MANHTGEVYNLLHIQKEGGHTILMVSGTVFSYTALRIWTM